MPRRGEFLVNTAAADRADGDFAAALFAHRDNTVDLAQIADERPVGVVGDACALLMFQNPYLPVDVMRIAIAARCREGVNHVLRTIQRPMYGLVIREQVQALFYAAKIQWRGKKRKPKNEAASGAVA